MQDRATAPVKRTAGRTWQTSGTQPGIIVAVCLERGRDLTLPLHHGVTWHDGKPFTAKDVQCAWDMLTGKSSEKLKTRYGRAWRAVHRVMGREGGRHEFAADSSQGRARFEPSVPRLWSAHRGAARRDPRFLGPIPPNDVTCYFRSTISIQFGCVPIA